MAAAMTAALSLPTVAMAMTLPGVLMVALLGVAVNLLAAAGRAFPGAFGLLGHLPRAAACITHKRAHFAHLNNSSMNCNCLPMHKRLSDLAAAAFKHTPERGTRHSHALRSLVMVKAFKVRETHRLEFVKQQNNPLQIASGNTGWLEQHGFGLKADTTATDGTWHSRNLVNVSTGQMSICS
jgi:hypothetical protein